MSNEISLSVSLRVNGTTIDWKSSGGNYRDSFVGTAKGPVLGTIQVSENGVDLNLSELGLPGWCWLENQSADKTIRIGRFDYLYNRFYPMLLLRPRQGYPVLLDPYSEEEFTGTGTGTTASLTTIRAKVVGTTPAFTDETANLLVQAFEA